ncbi:MAG: hypothetical protein IKI50_04900 [Clostridia bacterium]|nr:hypothetical protein [Clostridia bacterium]
MLKKTLSCLLCAMLLLTLLAAAVPAAADDNYYRFKATTSGWHDSDGGYYATGIQIEAGKDEYEIILTEHESGVNRCLWSTFNEIVMDYPFLWIEMENPDAAEKITISKYWDMEPELEIPVQEGLYCVHLYELLLEQDTIGYTYIVPYVKKDQTLTIKQMYLSATDENGDIYVMPTQPPVPDGQAGHMIRYDMPAYTEDHVEEDTGYSWLMSEGCDVVPGADGKGFTLARADGSDLPAINIAWVVPYEQLAQTPYLVVEIGNEGRPDEGPQVAIYSYWEHVVGSLAVFDGMGSRNHGANGLNGVNAYNLKYAVDNVKEELHGEDGIAIIIGLNLANARTDGTVLDELVVKDAYLMGWEDGYAGDGLFVDMDLTAPTDPTTPSTQSGTPATQPTDKPADGGESEGSFPWLIVGIVAAVVVVGVVVAVIVIKKKK